MSGLLRRLTRRGPATVDEDRSPEIASSEPVAAPAETPAEPGGQTTPAPAEQPTVALPAAAEQPLPAWTVAAGQPTAFAAQPAPARDLPAGVDPGDLAAAPAASARRGKLRRRLRYLRHVRELLLRDLGGFTYEVHRTAGGNVQEPQRRLAAAKAERLSALDAEVLALEAQLGVPHEAAVLREPGIGGTCRECGELHASDAHFCSRCGAPLDDTARAQRAAEQPATGSQTVTEPPTTGSHAVVEPQPASVLWAGGPRPAPEPEQEAPQPPSAVTSQWLATDQPTTFDRAARPDAPAATTDEPAAAVPATKEDEPAVADEPATVVAEPNELAPDDPPAARDEPATAVDVPTADDAASAPARPERAAEPRKPAPAEPRAEAPDPETFEANGRRDEDVPPPVSSGDPLASRKEPGS
jgi:hypothetical protein